MHRQFGAEYQLPLPLETYDGDGELIKIKLKTKITETNRRTFFEDVSGFLDDARLLLWVQRAGRDETSGCRLMDGAFPHFRFAYHLERPIQTRIAPAGP